MDIYFTIDHEGNVTIDNVEGVEGDTCLDVTRVFEKALGLVKESSRKRTDKNPPIKKCTSLKKS